jgi:hypothetical protein
MGSGSGDSGWGIGWAGRWAWQFSLASAKARLGCSSVLCATAGVGDGAVTTIGVDNLIYRGYLQASRNCGSSHGAKGLGCQPDGVWRVGKSMFNALCNRLGRLVVLAKGGLWWS